MMKQPPKWENITKQLVNFPQQKDRQTSPQNRQARRLSAFQLLQSRRREDPGCGAARFFFFSPWEKDGHIWKPWESGILKLGFDLQTLIVFFPLVNPPFGAPTCGTFPAYFQFLSEKLLFDWAHR